jgi:hypothetical protein
VSPAPPPDGRPRIAVLVLLPVFGILTWTRLLPSLSLHCQFPHCKHFNDLSCFPRFPAHKASKKTAHPITSRLVSRKALQNYSRRTYWQNFYDIIF